jgi:ubiquinone/menaquinone biosynthesis C-methylase UbiE
MNRDDLMRVSRGYWESRAILTGVELGVFTNLGRRKLSAKVLAKRIGAVERGTELLLDCLAGMDVLVKSGSSYAIAGPMIPHLTEGPESALGMLRHHAALWENWSRMTEVVRDGNPAPSKSSFRRGPEEARAFTMAMRAGALRLAPGVAAELNLKGRRHLLDLGGGPGVYAAHFARVNPDLRVTVVDLPDVALVGEEIREEYPDVKDRIGFLGTDFERDALPTDADSAFLSHVIHGQGEDEVRALFCRVADALPKKGLFIVRDFFTGHDRTTPPSASLFALNMLVNTTAGRTYSTREVAVWLKQAGFATATVRRSKAAPDADYVLARK